MAKALPKVFIGRNQHGWFIFNIDTLTIIGQYFFSKAAAKEEFYEYEGERWEYGEYNPFGS